MKLSLKVIPSSKQNKIIEDITDLLGVRNLKVKVSQPPESGRANKALIEVLADYFKVKKSAIKIIAGETSRNKIIEIDLPSLR